MTYYPTNFDEEMKRKTIEQQRAKLATYDALVEEKLPIPYDLKGEIEDQGVRPARTGV